MINLNIRVIDDRKLCIDSLTYRMSVEEADYIITEIKMNGFLYWDEESHYQTYYLRKSFIRCADLKFKIDDLEPTEQMLFYCIEVEAGKQ